MTFRVGGMGGLRLDEEKTVILLSNLLDNAIHECVKVARQGRNAVIHVKLSLNAVSGRLSNRVKC